MLRLLPVRSDEVLCRLPLSSGDWTAEPLESEMDDFMREAQNYVHLMEALTNMNKFSMLHYLIMDEDSTQSYNDFLIGSDMNLQTARKHTKRLESPQRGKYRLFRRGAANTR